MDRKEAIEAHKIPGARQVVDPSLNYTMTYMEKVVQ